MHGHGVVCIPLSPQPVTPAPPAPVYPSQHPLNASLRSRPRPTSPTSAKPIGAGSVSWIPELYAASRPGPYAGRRADPAANLSAVAADATDATATLEQFSCDWALDVFKTVPFCLMENGVELDAPGLYLQENGSSRLSQEIQGVIAG